MSENRLIDTLKRDHISIEPEKLADFEDRELTLRSFQFLMGNYDKPYAILDTVDENGEGHMLSTGGATIMRCLGAIDQETDLPTQVKFVKVISGTGRKVWSIQ